MEKRFVSALLIAVGIAVSGLFIYLGIHEMASRDRIVAVKGLSERTVKADHVVWPLTFSVSGNDLVALYAQLNQLERQVQQFFLGKGFAKKDMSLGNVSVNDNWENYYEHRPEYRYTISSSLIISTDDVDRVVSNQGCQAELLKQGLIINSSQWSTKYQYNGLSELKPEMIEEATKNARVVAQKFADDAQCSLGSISYANQGQFSISEDDNQPWIMHVRVVTTVNYYLK